jgi:hypothetical protein
MQLELSIHKFVSIPSAAHRVFLPSLTMQQFRVLKQVDRLMNGVLIYSLTTPIFTARWIQMISGVQKESPDHNRLAHFGNLQSRQEIAH